MKQNLENLLNPHPWALFEILENDEDVAKCIDQRKSNFEMGQQIGIFDLAPLMRVLLKKSNLCNEEYINSLITKKNEQMGIIMNWERAKRLFLLLGPIKENFEEQKIISGLDTLRSSKAASKMVGSEEKGRLFPRYDISNIPTKVECENKHGGVILREIGVTGIKLESQTQLKELDGQNIRLKIKDQTFQMKLFLSWESMNKDQTQYEAGFNLRFDKKEDFEKWFILTKALHRLKYKKRTNDTV